MRITVVFVLLIVPVAGCGLIGGSRGTAVVPAPLARVTHYAGSPLVGPQAQGLGDVDPGSTPCVRVTFIGVRHDPPGRWVALGSEARLIEATSGGAPVVASGRLTLGTRLLSEQEARAFVHELAMGPPESGTVIATLTGALPPGATADFRLTDGAAGETDRSAPRRCAVELYRPMVGATTDPATATDILETAISIEDRVGENPTVPAQAPAPTMARGSAARGARSSGAPARAAPVLPYMPVAGGSPAREMAIVDQRLVPDGQVSGWLIPFRFSGSLDEGVLAFVQIVPGARDDWQVAACARCAADLKASAELARERPASVPFAALGWPGFEASLAALGEPNRRRASLLDLATQTGAPLTQDVALTADDATLADLCTRVRGKTAAPARGNGGAYDAAALGWVLDQSSVELLDQELGAGKLPPELAAVLTRHAGEAGRHAEVLDEVVKGVTSLGDFEARLTAQNILYLDDVSPGARVRAYDWLTARGAAPPGYGPLAPFKQRRAALDAAENAAAAASSTGAKP